MLWLSCRMPGSIRLANWELRSFCLSTQPIRGVEGSREADSGSRQFRTQRRVKLHCPGLFPTRRACIQAHRSGMRNWIQLINNLIEGEKDINKLFDVDIGERQVSVRWADQEGGEESAYKVRVLYETLYARGRGFQSADRRCGSGLWGGSGRNSWANGASTRAVSVFSCTRYYKIIANIFII